MDLQAAPGCFTSDDSGQDILQELSRERESCRLYDLPEACLAVVLCSMGSTDRLALFSTSRSMAAAVLHSFTCEGEATQGGVGQHRSGLTLQPAAALQEDSSRRAAVLGLAKGCRNLHLRLQGHTIPLDMDGVTECITHLTLCDISLGNRTFSSLPLQQLTQLHTLTLECGSLEFQPKIVRADILARVIQGGGLPMLRTLHGKGKDRWQPQSGMLLDALAPALGPVITHLAMDSLSNTHRLCDYTRLQMLEHYGTRTGSTVGVYHQLFGLPNLRRVVIPGAGDSPYGEAIQGVGCVCVLELYGIICPRFLSTLPLNKVQHLRLNGRLGEANAEVATAAVQNMQRCNTVELVPQTALPDGSVVGPTAWLPFQPPFLHWFARQMQEFEGALGLVSHVGKLQLGALSQIPPGVHTVFCHIWLPIDCTWAEVMTHMPPHVQHVKIHCAFITADHLSAITAQGSAWFDATTEATHAGWHILRRIGAA